MNNLQITNCLKLWDITKKSFKGVFPYDTIPIPFKKYKKLQIFIFNNQNSSQPGQHWLLLALKNNNAFIFDSLNIFPLKKLILKLKKQNFIIHRNKYRIQALNSHVCGYYVVIISLFIALGLKYKTLFERNDFKNNDNLIITFFNYLIPAKQK